MKARGVVRRPLERHWGSGFGFSDVQILQHVWMLVRTEGGEKQDTGPIRYYAHLRDNLNEPKLLHLLKHRKALKSLTWEVQLLWLAVIFWWLTTCIPSPPWPCPTTTTISWLCPCLFGAVPQSDLRGCLPCCSPQQGPWIKYYLQSVGCTF